MEIAWPMIARMAYEKYADTLDCEVETFDQLDANDRTAWIEAVKYAVDVYVRAVTA